MKQPAMWTYKGVNVYPAELNGSGIRWYAVDTLCPLVLRFSGLTPKLVCAG